MHDELVLEVDPSLIKEAALLLRNCMESAALLLGMCFTILLHIGYCFGSCKYCVSIFYSSTQYQAESWENMGFFGAVSCR